METFIYIIIGLALLPAAIKVIAWIIGFLFVGSLVTKSVIEYKLKQKEELERREIEIIDIELDLHIEAAKEINKNGKYIVSKDIVYTSDGNGGFLRNGKRTLMLDLLSESLS